MIDKTPPDIFIQNFTLYFEGQALFKDFVLTLPAQKWVCLLGPSGVGKTTILRFIAKLLDRSSVPLTGKIVTSDGEPLTNRIAYMAQQDLLMPWLSVLDNVLIGYRLRNSKHQAEIRKKAINLLETVGLGAFLQSRPATLSGGMRQRVALVRTLLEERPIVLMDEPFSGLDIITKMKLQTLAAELLANRSVLFVTHDPLEALRLGDEIYVMTGMPVALSQAIKPAGKAPRDPANPHLLFQQAELLESLGC